MSIEPRKADYVVSVACLFAAALMFTLSMTAQVTNGALWVTDDWTAPIASAITSI